MCPNSGHITFCKRKTPIGGYDYGIGGSNLIYFTKNSKFMSLFGEYKHIYYKAKNFRHFA